LQQTPEQFAAEVLTRCSVMDLVEQQPADILRMSERFDGLDVARSGQIGFFNFATVVSGENAYEVRLFGTFMFCSCPGFFFNHICRHAVYAFSRIDTRSFNRICDQESYTQDREAISSAVYAPPKIKAEKIGNFVI
jgi:hypothetical protein